jgi:hypothetical protein
LDVVIISKISSFSLAESVDGCQLHCMLRGGGGGAVVKAFKSLGSLKGLSGELEVGQKWVLMMRTDELYNSFAPFLKF